MLKKLAIGLGIASMGMSAAFAGDIDVAATNVNTNNGGFYVKGQGGYDWSSIKSDQGVTNSSLDSNGFAGRLAAGYAFNQYLSLEAGASYMRLASESGTLNGVKFSSSASAAVYDVMALGTLPINNFFVYGGAGAAYVHTFGKATIDGTTITASGNNKVLPKAVVGVGYNITPHLAADVSYSHIFGTSTTAAHYVPSIDAVMVGVTYNFG